MSISDYPVITNPAQLLRFLGVSGPEAPDRVSSLIQAQVNILPWWLASLEQTLNVSMALGAGVVGLLTTAATLVPANQRWLVVAFSGVSTVGAAGTLKLTAGYSRAGASFVSGASNEGAAAELVVVDGFAGRGRDGWLLLNPGDSIGMMVQRNTAAAPGAVTTNLRYVSFPA